MNAARFAGERWTEEELDYLKGHYGTAPVEELAARLGRSVDAVRSKANTICPTQRHRSDLPDYPPVFAHLCGRCGHMWAAATRETCCPKCGAGAKR